MAESTTPSGNEQLRIIKMLLQEQSNSSNPTPSYDSNGHEDLLDIHEEGNHFYVVSASWIVKWLHHVTLARPIYPGRLTMGTMVFGERVCDFRKFLEFKHLANTSSQYMDGTYEWSTGNMWVHQTVWFRLVQWYGVEDGHELDRYNCYREPRWLVLDISLKGDLGTSLANTPKRFHLIEKCGYIELQIRRFFGVTYDTVTQLRLMPNPTVLDRNKELIDYTPDTVRYDTVF